MAKELAAGSFGELVEKVLESQGRSKNWLGAQLGMSRTTLWRFLSTDDVTIGHVERVATVLGVAPDRLIPPAMLRRLLAGREGSQAVDTPPSVMAGLPQQARVWLQEFLLEMAKAGASDREIISARTTLTSPESQEIYAGGTAPDVPVDELIAGMEVQADAIRRQLRKRGRKIRK